MWPGGPLPSGARALEVNEGEMDGTSSSRKRMRTDRRSASDIGRRRAACRAKEGAPPPPLGTTRVIELTALQEDAVRPGGGRPQVPWVYKTG